LASGAPAMTVLQTISTTAVGIGTIMAMPSLRAVPR
jgi:hypothetical protein